MGAEESDWVLFLPEVPECQHPVLGASAEDVALGRVFGQAGDAHLLVGQDAGGGGLLATAAGPRRHSQVPNLQLASHIAHY